MLSSEHFLHFLTTIAEAREAATAKLDFDGLRDISDFLDAPHLGFTPPDPSLVADCESWTDALELAADLLAAESDSWDAVSIWRGLNSIIAGDDSPIRSAIESLPAARRLWVFQAISNELTPEQRSHIDEVINDGNCGKFQNSAAEQEAADSRTDRRWQVAKPAVAAFSLSRPKGQQREELVAAAIKKAKRRKDFSITAERLRIELLGLGYEVARRTIEKSPAYKKLLLDVGRTRRQQPRKIIENQLDGHILANLVDEQRESRQPRRTQRSQVR